MVSRCGPRVEKSPLIAFSHTVLSFSILHSPFSLLFLSTSSTGFPSSFSLTSSLYVYSSSSFVSSSSSSSSSFVVAFFLAAFLLAILSYPSLFLSVCLSVCLSLSILHRRLLRLLRVPHRRGRTSDCTRMSRDFSQTLASLSLRTYNVQLPEDQITRGMGEALYARYAITKPRSHWPT